MAEVMQRQSGGGAVAAISPTGLGLTSDQMALRQRLMDELFAKGTRDLGRGLLNAKKRFYAEVQKGTGAPNYLLYTTTLFGDPAMRLPISGNAPARLPSQRRAVRTTLP